MMTWQKIVFTKQGSTQMDKLKQYQKVIRQVLTDYARFLESSPDANYKVAMLFDDEHGQYAVRRIGT